MTGLFEKGRPGYEILYDWWKETISDDEHDKNHRKNKGERAELARCASVTEVLLCPAFYNIAGELEGAGFDRAKRESLAAMVGLLAHIRHEDDQFSVPGSMAHGDTPKVSPPRFRRLLEAQTADELYPVMRRILALLDKTANINDLAASVYGWDNETRKRWASDYFVVAARKAAHS